MRRLNVHHIFQTSLLILTLSVSTLFLGSCENRSASELANTRWALISDSGHETVYAFNSDASEFMQENGLTIYKKRGRKYYPVTFGIDGKYSFSVGEKVEIKLVDNGLEITVTNRDSEVWTEHYNKIAE